MAENFSNHNNKNNIKNKINKLILDLDFLWHFTEWQLKIVIAQTIINMPKSLLKWYKK